MKKIKYFIKLAFILTISSCGGGSEDSTNPTNNGTTNEDKNNRIPKAVYDLASFTASYLLDTDKDGDDDIILGPAGGVTADLLLINDGKGFFTIKTNAFPAHYQGTKGQTVNITSADFNKDGRQDIIATTIDARDGTFSQSAKIHLYLNNGDNTFSDATNKITDNLISVGWVEWIKVGDFNKDGNLDFITTSSGGFGMNPTTGIFQGGYIYLNDGSANFSRTTITMNDGLNGVNGEYTYPVLAWDAGHRKNIDRFPLDILAGDVDNDGDMDLVAPNGYAGGLWATFINKSTGTNVKFDVIYNGEKNGDPFSATFFKNGALIDINGDGFLDVVGSESIAGGPGSALVPMYTFLNDGTGKFTETTNLISGTAPGMNHARQWLVADFNKDGKKDLFVADHGYDALPFPGFPNTLLLASGGKLSNSSSNVGTISAFTHGAAIGDIDKNGTIDIFMNNHQGLEGIGGAKADFFVYLNNGSAVFTGAK